MMNRLMRYVSASLVLSTVVGAVWARGYEARVRVVHASPDAPAVDVRVEGQPAFQEVAFGDVTDYAALRAGTYDVEVVPAGQTSPVVIDLTGEDAVNLFYNTDYTVVAVNTLNEIEPLLLKDDNRPASMRFARVRFVHASPDAPAVDIAVVGGPILFRNVSFKGVGDYVRVPAGTYDLEVRVAGTRTVALEIPAVTFEQGTTYTAFAVGFATGGSPALSARLSVDAENPAKNKSMKRR